MPLGVYLFIGAWFACGLIQWPICLAYFQRKFPGLAEQDIVQDRRRAIIGVLLGPAGLFATLMVCGTRHGLKWW